MKQHKAPRKHDDAEYHDTGYWYYYWPSLRCTFRTDYPDMRFDEKEEVEELTVFEFIDRSLELYGNKECVPHAPVGDYYYYASADGVVFKTEDQLTSANQGLFEIKPSEYMVVSMLTDQNPEDVLL